MAIFQLNSVETVWQLIFIVVSNVDAYKFA